MRNLLLHAKKLSVTAAASLVLIFAGKAQETVLTHVGLLPAPLEESSGLIFTPRGLFSLADDMRPEVFVLDPASALIVQTVTVKDLKFKDKEALTADDEYLYIGDFGNNDGDRKDLKIVKVKLDDIGTDARTEVSGSVIAFHYPEQTDFNMKKKENDFDCEAMVAFGDSLYLFTKQRSDHRTTLYALPKTPGEYPAKKRGVFDSQGRVTDAALSPDGKTLLLLGYQKKHQFPFVWKITDFEDADFFSGRADYDLLSKFPVDWQTEGLAFKDNEVIFFSCEGSDDVKAGLYRAALKDLTDDGKGE